MHILRLLFRFTIVLLNVLFLSESLFSQTMVTLQTSLGALKIVLYAETPLHQNNFIKLTEQGFFDGLLFHRVIPGFMVQAGDPNSRNATPGQPLGDGGPGYTIPAELNTSFYHKRGAVAAARQSDAVNPLKASSGSQFYIVQGNTFTDGQLDALVNANRHAPFTEEQRKIYNSLGGAPHLDGAYTVFGEVIEGLEILDQIAAVKTDKRNRPISDIRIVKAYLTK
jgi:peptidyl-prolyl cis-trans isomerase B (cyclophilin B)